jgi:type I restriction enzyme S subunit
VLATYGALIENNRGRMALLEKTARLLYDEWFVRLRFPGHQRARMIGGLPEGWQPVPFSALADFVNGYPFKPEELGDDGLPIVKIPELRAGVSPKTPRNTGENIPEKYLLQDGNLLFSWSGTLLVEFWYDGPAILNQHLFRVETNDSCARVFMLQALRQALPEFTNQTTGATLKHIRKSALTTVKTNLPPRALLEQFDEFASMVYRQILSLRRQNSNLVKARDLLLPRLMSGEIAV